MDSCGTFSIVDSTVAIGNGERLESNDSSTSFGNWAMSGFSSSLEEVDVSSSALVYILETERFEFA